MAKLIASVPLPSNLGLKDPVFQKWLNTIANLLNNISPQNQYIQPLTGFSNTIPNGISQIIIDPAGTIAAGTVVMPEIPYDNQKVGICSTNIITSLTVSANSNQTLNGAITAIAKNGFATWQFKASNQTWYRIA